MTHLTKLMKLKRRALLQYKSLLCHLLTCCNFCFNLFLFLLTHAYSFIFSLQESAVHFSCIQPHFLIKYSHCIRTAKPQSTEVRWTEKYLQKPDDHRPRIICFVNSLIYTLDFLPIWANGHLLTLHLELSHESTGRTDHSTQWAGELLKSSLRVDLWMLEIKDCTHNGHKARSAVYHP